MLLILTVGTGTAGRSSSVVDGLVASMRLAECNRFLLVPSASPNSRDVADFVRACAPEGTSEFVFQEGGRPELSLHDDLEQCRKELLGLFHRLRECGESDFVLNPTSGTKQMSAAAILAGLEAGVEKIHYTVGERADGVVKTGTEKLQPLDTATIHAARARADARRLLHAGAFSGARELLSPWSGIAASRFLMDAAALMNAWARFAYQEAASTARRLPHEKVATWAKIFDQLHAGGPESPPFVADLLDHADFLAAREETTIAFATLYRATEQAAKTVLARDHRIRPPYPVEDLLPIAPQRKQEVFRLKARDGHLHLGLYDAMELLRDFDDPLGRFFFGERSFRKLLDLRHETVFGHGHRPVPAKSLADLRQFLDTALKEAGLAKAPLLRRKQVLASLLASSP